MQVVGALVSRRRPMTWRAMAVTSSNDALRVEIQAWATCASAPRPEFDRPPPRSRARAKQVSRCRTRLVLGAYVGDRGVGEREVRVLRTALSYIWSANRDPGAQPTA